MLDDSRLQTDVLGALGHDARIVASDIGVGVHDGVVTLTGEVASLVQRTTAAQLTQGVTGVRSIANEIVVRLPIDQHRTDVDIAHDAVSALMWDTEVPDKTIKARVQDRWIWLVGEADWHYQRVAAEHAVENIAGVKGVTNLVRIKRHPHQDDIRGPIEAALVRTLGPLGREISVSSDDGRVILGGVVRTMPERTAAEYAAWSAPGVTEVVNRLEVSR